MTIVYFWCPGAAFAVEQGVVRVIEVPRLLLFFLISITAHAQVYAIGDEPALNQNRSFCIALFRGVVAKIRDLRQERALRKMEGARLMLEMHLEQEGKSGNPLTAQLTQDWKALLQHAFQSNTALEVEAIDGRDGKFHRAVLAPEKCEIAFRNIDNAPGGNVEAFIVPAESFQGGHYGDRTTLPQFTFLPGQLNPLDKQRLESIFELNDRANRLENKLHEITSTNFMTEGSMARLREDERFANFKSVLVGGDRAVVTKKNTFGVDLPRMKNLAMKYDPKVWDKVVDRIVDFARREFKDIEPQEMSVRELLQSVSYLDERLKPENVFEDNAIPQSEMPTADVDTIEDLRRLIDERADAHRPIEETLKMIAPLAAIEPPRGVKAKAAGKEIDQLLEIVGTNLTRVNGYDFKALRERRPEEYQKAKEKIQSIVRAAYPPWFRSVHRLIEVQSVIEHIERTTSDNWELSDAFGYR